MNAILGRSLLLTIFVALIAIVTWCAATGRLSFPEHGQSSYGEATR